jgi:hypothetical protein
MVPGTDSVVGFASDSNSGPLVPGTDSGERFGARKGSTFWRQVATAGGFWCLAPIPGGRRIGRIGPGGWFRGKIEPSFRRIFQGIYPLGATILGRCDRTDDSILMTHTWHLATRPKFGTGVRCSISTNAGF